MSLQKNPTHYPGVVRFGALKAKVKRERDSSIERRPRT